MDFATDFLGALDWPGMVAMLLVGLLPLMVYAAWEASR